MPSSQLLDQRNNPPGKKLKVTFFFRLTLVTSLKNCLSYAQGDRLSYCLIRFRAMLTALYFELLVAREFFCLQSLIGLNCDVNHKTLCYKICLFYIDADIGNFSFNHRQLLKTRDETAR